MAIFDWLTGKGACRKQIRELREQVLTAEPQEQVLLLGQIGDLCRDQLRDRKRALRAYNEALALEPDDQTLLQKVLELHTAARHWSEMAALLERLAQLEPDKGLRWKYHFGAAMILRDEVKDYPAAIRALEAAAALDPGNERIVEALRELKERS